MKKVFAFSLLALIFAACNSTGKFKPAVDDLAAKWDSTTSAVTEFATSLATEQANWSSSMATVQPVTPEAMAKWDEATKAKYNEIQTGVANAETGLTGLSGEVQAYITNWQAKSKELEALKAGVAAGKLEGDPQEKITALNTEITNASTQLESWKAKMNEWKASAANSQKMLSDFVATMPANDPKSGKK